MKKLKIDYLLKDLIGTKVERPNRNTAGTLSGHAAGEPFEKYVYQYLKKMYSNTVFKQFEFLNDLFTKHPQVISLSDRLALLNSPTALFLLSRGDKAMREWSPEHIFEEKQNDTADILHYYEGHYELIDVKTRNINKNAQPPNIISAYKLAKACAIMIDNKDFDSIDIHYIEVDWHESGSELECIAAHYGNLFKINPQTLYINWAAAMQIQFHVSEIDQNWTNNKEEWARLYIRCFVESAKHRVELMHEKYITPFLQYL